MARAFPDNVLDAGDVLIVGLNSDASIRRYKSAHRPVIPQRDRLKMVAALQAVDYLYLRPAFAEAHLEARPDGHRNHEDKNQTE